MLTRISPPLVRFLISRELGRSLRRICWVGAVPEIPAGTPVIAYSNHNHFLDGHLLWLAARRIFGRPFVIWMEELERFPFFVSEGALPFPKDDAAVRSRTIRTTRSRLGAQPSPLLAYFPGGALSSPESALPEQDTRTFERLGRIMPAAAWLPVAIHVTWWGESLPTALLAAGVPHNGPSGDEIRRLQEVLETLRRPEPTVTKTLLEGRPGPNERWNLAFLGRFFPPC